jgi:HEAT repeat protein
MLSLGRYLLVPLLSLGLAAQVADLKDPDPETRAKAASKLGKEGDARHIPALRPLIKDPVLDVRAEATGAILRIGTQHSLEPLMEATRDADSTIQSMAVDGLVNFYYPGYVKSGWGAAFKSFGGSLKGRFSRPEPMVLDPSVPVSDDVIKAITPLITGGSSMESRANAARAVGILRARAALPELMKALRSKNTMVILESVRSLEKIGERSVGPELIFLLQDLDEEVQFTVVQIMGQFVVTEATPDLVDLVKTSPKKKIRRQSLIAVAKMRDPAQRPLFVQHLQDKDKQMRAAAGEGIGRLGNEGDLQVVLDAFAREKNESARLSLAFAAASLGDLSFLTYLYDGLNSSFHRLEARPFLVELARDPTVLVQLYHPLANGTNDQKKHLAYVVSISGNKESLTHLERLTHDPDPKVAQEAIRAMGNLQARL